VKTTCLRLRLAGVTFAAGLLLLAGCGGTAKLAPQDVGADQQAALRASLSLSDLPAGWTSDGSGQFGNGGDPTLEKCLGIAAARLFDNAPAAVNSSQFSDNADRTLQDSVGYEPTTAAAVHDFPVYQGASFAGCLKMTLIDGMTAPDPSDPGDSLPAGTTVGNTSVVRLPFSTMGDRSVAYRLTITFQNHGASVTENIDFLVAVKGRVGVQVALFSTTASPFAASDEEGYMTLILGRLSRI